MLNYVPSQSGDSALISVIFHPPFFVILAYSLTSLLLINAITIGGFTGVRLCEDMVKICKDVFTNPYILELSNVVECILVF